MILQVYTVYDEDAEEYGPMWVAPTDKVAIRQHKAMCEKLPEKGVQYRLTKIGTYETKTGIMCSDVRKIDKIEMIAEPIKDLTEVK
jgi:hypothetical protein